ncbi:hypothetical protein [Streptomyces sp. NPDC052496]|uniref:hypothetical protein n=1 Tax=Streptomyces sp. NPDC052496 TaxID=3154951 RepID=UPI0034216ECD
MRTEALIGRVEAESGQRGVRGEEVGVGAVEVDVDEVAEVPEVAEAVGARVVRAVKVARVAVRVARRVVVGLAGRWRLG